jgi:AcrR family transcriptional regulator
MTDQSVLNEGLAMSPRTVDRNEKMNQIKRAALRVFARKGISRAKMIDIAEAAGVGKGTLYEYFPSKERLIVGAFGTVIEDFNRTVAAGMAEVASPREKLEAYIRASCEFYSKNRSHLEVLFDIWGMAVPRVDNQILFADFKPAYEAALRLLTDVIEEGVSVGVFRPLASDSAASLILAMLDGLVAQAVLGLTDIDDNELPHRVTKMVLEGVTR